MIRIGRDGLRVPQESSALGIVLGLSTLSGLGFEWNGYRLESAGRRLVEGIKDITGSVDEQGDGLSFSPGQTRAGSYRLELDGVEPVTPALLALTPLLAQADGPSELTFVGATHGEEAPPYEAVESTWVSLMRRAGLELSVRLTRSGFPPRGGGEIVASFEGRRSIHGLELIDRGGLKALQIVSAVCGMPAHVQQRQASRARAGLASLGLPANVQLVKLPGRQPGQTVAITGVFEELPIAVSANGGRGRSAEAVGQEAASRFHRYVDTSGAVPGFLVEALVVTLAVGSGPSRVTTDRLPSRLAAVAGLVDAFLGRKVGIEGKPGGPGEVVID